MKVYYFGCRSNTEKGHYLSLGRNHAYGSNDVLPFKATHLDQLIKNQSKQSEATLFYLLGWTIITMADFSADKRPGSNAAFIIEGIVLKFDDILSIAEKHYPEQFQRITEAKPIYLPADKSSLIQV